MATVNRLNMIRKLLVANRGEIACRIMRTAKRMNIQTLAVYSDIDRNSLHVKLADEALYIGEAEPQKSYLNHEKILDLSKKNQVSAIHPGYGFLSENYEFSQRCLDEQLVFVGPKPESIRAMGIKNESKRIMIEAGVPVVPGYHGLDQSDGLLLEEARKIGYPVLIKPVRGGGGKGMRVVSKEEEFLEMLESSRRESLKSFNDQSVLLEKYIVKPRHVEVQVFGDHHQNYVYLFERDCSVQRRHQKIIEEAPAPLIGEDKRRELGEKAVAAARAVNYVGAGTVEFILDKDTGEFYFMEMNTRLQVEHPITEMITNTDLVEWQLRVASGERLPKLQSDIMFSGHAFEARIYAEDPEDNFLPQTGQLNYINLPEGTDGHLSEQVIDRNKVRVDTGVTMGDVISPYYDPMIAKLVVWDQDRTQALKKLNAALEQYVVVGVPTNIKFLTSLSTNNSFKEADVGTDFIDLHQNELFESMKSQQSSDPKQQDVIPEICAVLHPLISSGTNSKLPSDLTSFRTIRGRPPSYQFNLKSSSNGQSYKATYKSQHGNTGLISIVPTQTESDKTPEPSSIFEGAVNFKNEGDSIRVDLGDQLGCHRFLIKSKPLTGSEETIVVLQDGLGRNKLFTIENRNIFLKAGGNEESNNEDPLLASAPMPGIIEKVLVSVGDLVSKGQSLIIISAMKMEHTVKSRADGLVKELIYKPGDFVSKASTLIRLESNE